MEVVGVRGIAHEEVPASVELVAHQPHDERRVVRGTDLLAQPHLVRGRAKVRVRVRVRVRGRGRGRVRGRVRVGVGLKLRVRVRVRACLGPLDLQSTVERRLRG